MEIIMRFNTMPMERFRELVDWLDNSPFDIHNLDLQGVLEKGDVKINIQAPKVSRVKPVAPTGGVPQ